MAKPKNRRTKSSRLRWLIGAVVVLILLLCGLSTVYVPLFKPITSVFSGYRYAYWLLPWGEKNAPLTGLAVQIGGTLQAPHVDGLDYLFDSGMTKGRSFMIMLKNPSRSGFLSSGEGLDVEAIRKKDPFLHSPLDLQSVGVDIEHALDIAGQMALHEFGRFAERDLHMDMRLANTRDGLVWEVSYDAWTADGPQVVGHIFIDARTGRVLTTNLTRAVTQPSTSAG